MNSLSAHCAATPHLAASGPCRRPDGFEIPDKIEGGKPGEYLSGMSMNCFLTNSRIISGHLRQLDLAALRPDK